ncbi:hypothetical protein [Rhizobium grahamii]|uniref:Uncharacterized protein n=1 Tax=Rhizobium grahamii TaxID=1120045 RepID=A0A370KRI5_9HYPH|nr:hypothetical protein [Rhizobium grahamii]RDJ12411.1 hypothetical protein B5K06_11795 [Rhizobium grahamii]
MDCHDHNSVYSDPGTLPANDARVTVIPDESQPAYNGIVTAKVHSIGHDFISTLHGVASYADSGAMRAVMRHLGPANGYEPSSGSTLLRAGEFQTLRAAGTQGGMFAVELGVHSEVPGDGWSKNVGIYLASSHAGWLPSGVRNDTAMLVTGEDGWHNVLLHLGTDGAWLYRITGDGSVWMNGYLDMPNLPFLSAQVIGICGANQDAKINPISAQGMNCDNAGAGGGSRLIIPRDGVYEVSFSVNALDNNTQVVLVKNGGVIPYGGSSNAGNQISCAPFTLKLVATETLAVRCLNGRFGGNPTFSNISIRKVG